MRFFAANLSRFIALTRVALISAPRVTKLVVSLVPTFGFHTNAARSSRDVFAAYTAIFLAATLLTAAIFPGLAGLILITALLATNWASCLRAQNTFVCTFALLAVVWAFSQIIFAKFNLGFANWAIADFAERAKIS